MSQQLLIDKALKIKSRTDNIEGNYSPEKMVLYDDFTGIALDAERWVFAGNNGGTEAITAGTNGTVTLTTSTSDNDRSIIASPLNFLCAKNPVIEACFKVSAATTVGINFGFSDATTEGDNVLAMELAAGALVNAKATDCVGFVFDTDDTYDHWYYGATKADTEGTPALAKATAWITSATNNATNPFSYPVSPGSNTITTTAAGSIYIDLPVGCTGTFTDGTGTFTGSVISLTAGRNTVVCTVAGTGTLVWGYTPSTTNMIYRVALDTLGNANFYINGNFVGRLATCVTTTAPLCVFLGVISRAGSAARVLTVDYVKAWQDR